MISLNVFNYYSMKSSTVLTKQQLLEQFQDVYWCWKTGNPLQNPSSYRQLYTSQEGIPVVIHSALKEKLDKMVQNCLSSFKMFKVSTSIVEYVGQYCESKSVCCLSVDVVDESFVWCGKL